VLAAAKSCFKGHSHQEVGMPLLHSHAPPSEIPKPICIVDDDEPVADSLQALLETFGFNVQSYGSGSEFLADERHRAAGCLLIDQHMPGTSGLDVVDNLRRRGIQIPTILISGRLDASIRERATRLGVRELLDKPVPAGRLIQAIRAIL
jgi:two-component system response regulator FixJ